MSSRVAEGRTSSLETLPEAVEGNMPEYRWENLASLGESSIWAWTNGDPDLSS